MPTPTPTQVRRPWRATLRTVFAGVIAFAALLPFLVEATHLDPAVYPWLGGILAVAAAVTRIMALPQVEEFLRRFFPWLAAEPSGGRRNDQAGHVDVAVVLLAGFLGVVLAIVWGILQLRS